MGLVEPLTAVAVVGVLVWFGTCLAEATCATVGEWNRRRAG